jgi:hypothetical protein
MEIDLALCEEMINEVKAEFIFSSVSSEFKIIGVYLQTHLT